MEEVLQLYTLGEEHALVAFCSVAWAATALVCESTCRAAGSSVR